MANWTAYRLIKAKGKEIGWPLHYKTDLTTHDRRILSRANAPAEFGWILRQCGTEFLVVGHDFSISVARYYAGDKLGYRVRFFWVTPMTIEEITGEEMIIRLLPKAESEN